MYSIINKVSSLRVPAWGNTHNFIAIHYLGCVGQNYELAPDGTGAHFTIFYDGSIYQRCSYDAVPWAVGTAGYYKQKHPKANNYSTISIELCVKKTNNKGSGNLAEDKDWYFTEETQNAAVWLVQKLMKDLNIPIENVLRHYDIVNKWCPAPYCCNNKYKTSWTWDEFKAKVAGKPVDSSEAPESDGYYRVRKTWKDTKSQLGAYIVLDNAKNNCPVGYTVYDSNGKAVYTPVAPITSGMQSAQIAGSEKEKASQILDIIHKCDNSGILYSVTAAQMILESGYCTTELSKKANNCFGMKCTLSGNTWQTVWDGRSKVNIRTQEQDRNGNTYYIYADFRKYPCIEDSIKDHAAYLLGAMNGSRKRYAGLTDCKDYKSAITLIKNSGYATDVSYISKICNIIQRFGLDKYDKEIIGNTKTDTGKITKISEWIQTIKDWEQKMIDVKAVYSNKNNKTDYEVALKQKPVLTNCALFVTHALQVAGIFGRKDKFYGFKGTLIKGSAASKMGTIGKITTYSKANVTADKANIPVGAIVTWHEGHTNVYLGKNDKGQMIWSDAGRGTNVGCKENSYWKSFRKTGNMPGYHVANVIALNLLDDVSKEEISTIEGRQYIVQAGAFAVEANAKKQVAALKKKGFEAIVKKRSNDWFVQCGVFKNKKNADDLIIRLKKAGFSAILRF